MANRGIAVMPYRISVSVSTYPGNIAFQIPLRATERDVYEFFSKAGKVRDVRLIMDRNSRYSRGVGYIEFCDAMSVPMAIALTGQLLLGQPVMVKVSKAEKNLVPST